MRIDLLREQRDGRSMSARLYQKMRIRSEFGFGVTVKMQAVTDYVSPYDYEHDEFGNNHLYRVPVSLPAIEAFQHREAINGSEEERAGRCS